MCVQGDRHKGNEPKKNQGRNPIIQVQPIKGINGQEVSLQQRHRTVVTVKN